jgi:hypothetical protein
MSIFFRIRYAHKRLISPRLATFVKDRWGGCMWALPVHILLGGGLATFCPVQKEEPVRLILLMQRENILYVTDTINVASFLADFYVLYTCYINLRRWNTWNVLEY